VSCGTSRCVERHIPLYATTVTWERDCDGENVPDPTEAIWRISSTRINATKTIIA
jgi:hypothetical protein